MEDIYLYNDFLSYLLLVINLITSLIMMFYYMQIMSILYIKNQKPEAEYNPLINTVTYIPGNEVLRVDVNPIAYSSDYVKSAGLVLISL
jgi:NADH:ubiquinone oxidoreductase subunit 2 (subunit N)